MRNIRLNTPQISIFFFDFVKKIDFIPTFSHVWCSAVLEKQKDAFIAKRGANWAQLCNQDSGGGGLRPAFLKVQKHHREDTLKNIPVKFQAKWTPIARDTSPSCWQLHRDFKGIENLFHLTVKTDVSTHKSVQ